MSSNPGLLVIAPDRRVARRAERIVLRAVPDAGSAYFLPRLVGWGRATDMILTGEPVNAEEALRIGLATRVWPDETFVKAWRAYATALAAGATAAYALTKEGLNASWEHGLESFLEIESGLQDRAGRTRDYAEGVKAFTAKRPARFEGR